MIVFRVAVFLICVCKALTVFGQSPGVLAPYNVVDEIESMNLDYKKPIGFDEIAGTECFKSWPKLEAIITCASRQLRSEDEQFVTFISMYRTFNEDDSVFLSKISPNGFVGTGWMHEASIKHHIERSWGKKAMKNLRKYVDYYPEKKAHRKFNVDSAMSYSIKLEPGDYYQNKYNHLDVLCLAKRRRGVIFLFCFYTDEGKKKFKENWKAIEETFRFRD